MADAQKLFRAEAVEHHVRGADRADILAIDPTSTGWGHWLLVAALFSCVAFAALGELTEYATGPAVVSVEGRLMLTAPQSALVSRVLVMPGNIVREGELIVEFYSSAETAELAAASRQFDTQLRKLLQYPEDHAAREALISLRTQRELAEKRLAQRSLRAPRRARVGDVRVRAGQFVEAGMSVLELVDEASSAHVTALLPGRYRPYLGVGKRIRFDLDGFVRRNEELEIRRVGEQIVGPAEASRYLGRDLADVLSVHGPVILVEAALPETSFEAHGQSFVYAHGMLGRAESPVHSEPIAFAFVPALKLWLERVDPREWRTWAARSYSALERRLARVLTTTEVR